MVRLELQRLKRFVENLLDLSRLQAGTAAPTQAIWTVDALAERALDELPDGDRVRVDVPADLPPLRTDAAQVERALVNVLENALKFSPSGSAVTLRAHRRGGEIVLRVEDHGPGVAVDEAAKVFEPFHHAGEAAVRGSGSRSARLHHGERWAHLGRGGAVRRRVVRDRAPCGGPEPGAGVMRTLLVVDDEPRFLRTLVTNLRGAGYAVETAATVEGALIAAKDGRIDALVLDLVLPDGSGTDVCLGIRVWSDVPIVVVSAVGEEREKVEALDAGADDYVVKPFALSELLARLRAVLRRVAPFDPPQGLACRAARDRP